MNVAQAATNVNSSIVTTQSSITADDTNGNGILDGNSEAITLQSIFSTTGPVSAGDYFTISYSDNISYYQQNPEDAATAFPTLVDPNTGEVIARSTFDPNTGLVTYTFTDYVNGKENIDMNLYTNLYVDRETVPNKTQDELFSFTLGGVTTSNNIDVQYAPYQNVNGVTSASVFEEVVSRVNNTENPGYYSQTIYVNPINSDLTNVTLDITTNTNAYPGNLANINEATTNIRIFEIADGSTLNESIYFDPNNTTATEVTGNYPVTFNGETATIDFGNTSSTFIVIVEDNLAPTTSETAEVAQLFRISSDQGMITGGNALEFNTSGGIGDGTPTTEEPTTEAPTTEAPTTEAPTTEAPEKLYDLGNYVWYDDNKDRQQDSNENPVPDVTVILRDRDGNEIDRTTTDENGHYIFENLPNGKYEVEFTNLPKDYIGTPVTIDEDNVDGNSNSQKTS
ncbi:SdrD B-like domain-containing protein, partial [Macrococcoides canis]|uniref:SdrD B-like domain-containing protein n=1 Tax=Macrococcoides canis TaxID=1855823 RepID=UPI0039EC24B0